MSDRRSADSSRYRNDDSRRYDDRSYDSSSHRERDRDDHQQYPNYGSSYSAPAGPAYPPPPSSSQGYGSSYAAPAGPAPPPPPSYVPDSSHYAPRSAGYHPGSYGGGGGGGQSYAAAPPSQGQSSYAGPTYAGPAAPSQSYAATGPGPSNQRDQQAAEEGRKIYIGGLPTYGITTEIVNSDFAQFGTIQDCFVPVNRDDPKKIRGIGFITFSDPAAAKAAIGAMHNRNYHGREITVNIAKPRAPDPKKTGEYHSSYYQGKYDAGGRLRPEFRGTDGEQQSADGAKEWSGHNNQWHPSREDYGMHTHGNSWDGSGRYGQRDPRPPPEGGRYD